MGALVNPPLPAIAARPAITAITDQASLGRRPSLMSVRKMFSVFLIGCGESPVGELAASIGGGATFTGTVPTLKKPVAISAQLAGRAKSRPTVIKNPKMMMSLAA